MSETLTEERARVLGTFETRVTRNRKGRTSFKVTSRRARRMIGAEPLLPDSSDQDIRLNGSTDLVALADAWMARFHPEEVHPVECTCTDLTVDAVVCDPWVKQGDSIVRRTPTVAAQYKVREVPVRACHCATFPRLLGSDLGLSYHDETPNTGLDYRPERKAMVRPRVVAYAAKPIDTHAARTAKRAAKRAVRASERADWQDEADTLIAALEATDEPEVTVPFEGVDVTIRRGKGTVWSVTIKRGDDIQRMRARTVGPIARAVIA